VASVAGVGAVSIAGCISREGHEGGYLYAQGIERVPDDAAVIDESESTLEHERIREAIDDLGTPLEVSEDEYGKLSTTLSQYRTTPMRAPNPLSARISSSSPTRSTGSR